MKYANHYYKQTSFELSKQKNKPELQIYINVRKWVVTRTNKTPYFRMVLDDEFVSKSTIKKPINIGKKLQENWVGTQSCYQHITYDEQSVKVLYGFHNRMSTDNIHKISHHLQLHDIVFLLNVSLLCKSLHAKQENSTKFTVTSKGHEHNRKSKDRYYVHGSCKIQFRTKWK